MANTYDLLRALRRPKILIRAARLGMTHHGGDGDGAAHSDTRTQPLEARIRRLAEHENLLEQERRDGDARYDMHKHIRVLTALLVEARPFILRGRSAV